MRLVRVAAYALAASAVLDVLTTAVGPSAGFAELNPLLAGAPWLLAPVNAAVAALLYLVERRGRLLQRYSRHLAATMLIATSARALAAVNNALHLLGAADTPLLTPQTAFLFAIPIAAIAADAVRRRTLRQ
ncbi:hypothetical protein Pisl_1416 [Pyrobaculum islandicum DSM 4184]|uniref:DUF5658 domain-containing protein n=1 Tax=Pyrobaculum islandicum (strain DSM 4184 / JCM 9189 / GEO3) TaxID=384616 RepID=A1RUE2_PYRIL|nr:hypothetical protein [Pyrobaculum islandicum]ABL88574.1 hypothetical protein Pisl_1416 [Pyrobaculum islandicum DSM 4184]